MKKIVSLTLALILALCALAVPTMAEEPTITIGMLTLLNRTEEGLSAKSDAFSVLMSGSADEEGAADQVESEPQPAIKSVVKFYDTMDAMLMALNAGEIQALNIYYTTARYLVSTNDNLIMVGQPGIGAGSAIQRFVDSLYICDFSFLLKEDRADLRDELNGVIAEMKADGTLDQLVQTQIEGAIQGEDIAPIEIPKIEGAETIRVAVTGSLPPMDYVAADGTPAGFSTAVMAEISRRIGRNVEFVVVDSVGRATALSSGVVDAVFWTETIEEWQRFAAMSPEERKEYFQSLDATDAEEEAIVAFEESLDFDAISNEDKPAGTITSDPYFSDSFSTVMDKETVQATYPEFPEAF